MCERTFTVRYLLQILDISQKTGEVGSEVVWNVRKDDTALSSYSGLIRCG